jgi:hypothetical protein
MKFANATKFHGKPGKGLGINPEDDSSTVGAALNLSSTVIRRAAGPFNVLAGLTTTTAQRLSHWSSQRFGAFDSFLTLQLTTKSSS